MRALEFVGITAGIAASAASLAVAYIRIKNEQRKSKGKSVMDVIFRPDKNNSTDNQ